MKMAKNGIEAMFKPHAKIHSDLQQSFSDSYVHEIVELPLCNAIEIPSDGETDAVGEIKPQPSGQWVAPRQEEGSIISPTTGSEMLFADSSAPGLVTAFE